MNFLAHIYLSGDNDFIKIGNFMADGIRGKQYEHLPEDMRKGIILHRAIDTFTDVHPIFRKGTKRLHGKYHHYAGVIMDVFYDHFLAKNWASYSNESLDDFVERFYQSLRDNFDALTEKTQHMLPYMKRIRIFSSCYIGVTALHGGCFTAIQYLNRESIWRHQVLQRNRPCMPEMALLSAWTRQKLTQTRFLDWVKTL